MSRRIDSVSKFIPASPAAIYAAFTEPSSMEQWVPPKNMTATILHFDFREGCSYRMRLTYKDNKDGHGKSSDNEDEVEVRFTKLMEGKRMEHAIAFESDDPAFSGVMRMIWTLDAVKNGTLVTIRA